MSKILWDNTSEKEYSTGVDRGVLYLTDGTGVPWNGLTSVDENAGSIETTDYYYDGVKYMQERYPGDYEGRLRALTYPDEFLQFDGYTELNNGVLLGHQPVYDRFGLSYRTLIGNDVDGLNHGYKIHILYNLTAVPEDTTYNSMTDQTSLTEFGWTLSGVPEVVEGHRPTVHIILDTTRLNPFLVRDIENVLYGTDAHPGPTPPLNVDGGGPTNPQTYDIISGGSPSASGGDLLEGGDVTGAPLPAPIVPGTAPMLPPLSELVALINNWIFIDIVDNGDGTWTATGPAEFISMLDSTTFQISSNSIVPIDDDTYEISTAHTF